MLLESRGISVKCPLSWKDNMEKSSLFIPFTELHSGELSDGASTLGDIEDQGHGRAVFYLYSPHLSEL